MYNRDDFRNRRLELAGELREQEVRVHIANARKRMIKVLQRDLYGDHTVLPIKYYLDASIITNGLQRAFSTAILLTGVRFACALHQMVKIVGS